MTRGNPSAPAAAVRLILAGLRRRSDPAPPAVPRRRLAVERAGIVAHPASVAKYLRATDGGGIPEMSGIAGSLLPPLYPAVWEGALVLELLGSGDLPFPRGGLVHLGGEAVQIRPLDVGDSVRCRVELDRVEPGSGGLQLTVRCRNWDGKGRLCTEDVIELLLRTATGGTGRSLPKPGPDEPDHAWKTLREWDLGAGHGRRYARASGDYNPIHLWSLTARPFGFRSPILHGFCTEAMVAQALIAGCLGGVPSALRRLIISFRRPLSLPARARLLVSATDGGGRFRIVADGAARPVAEGGWTGQG